jgi:DNA-binding transcriptional ArsR family regulator
MSRLGREMVFEALADEHRRLILDRLRKRNGQTLTQLCDGQQISRQAVTKHLKVLEEADLILTHRKGRERLHFLNPVPLHAVALRWLRQFDRVKLDALFAALPATAVEPREEN